MRVYVDPTTGERRYVAERLSDVSIAGSAMRVLSSAGPSACTTPGRSEARRQHRDDASPELGPADDRRCAVRTAAHAAGHDRAGRGRAEPRPERPVHQPRAVLARLRGPRPVRGPRRPQPAARAGQLPDDLREHARRVLPDPDRPASASRSTPGSTKTSPDGRTAGEQLAAARDAGPRARRRPQRDLGRHPQVARRRGHRDRPTTPRSRSTTPRSASGSSTRSTRS